MADIKQGDTVRIIDYDAMLNWLENRGYRECSRGNWHGNGPSFYFGMQSLCGTFCRVRSVYGGKLELSDGNTIHVEWVDSHGS